MRVLNIKAVTVLNVFLSHSFIVIQFLYLISCRKRCDRSGFRLLIRKVFGEITAQEEKSLN